MVDLLQVSHQFLYKPTDNTKYPIETFVEGSGACDTLAVFAAALMKAGLDSAIIYDTANGSQEDQLGLGHAMVGVELGQQPDDQSREYYYYMTDSNTGKTYYLAEATGGSGVFVKPWDYNIFGNAVGQSLGRFRRCSRRNTGYLNKKDGLLLQKGYPYIHPSE